MRTAWLASALVPAIAGAAQGFMVHQFYLPPGGIIAPSSGAFVNDGGGAFLYVASLVTSDRRAWQEHGAEILRTTWLACDPRGGGQDFGGLDNSFSLLLLGFGDDPTIPKYAGTNGMWLGAPGLRPDGSAIDGEANGFVWGAGIDAAFQAESSVSPVNGVSVDSIFLGYFVLTDPGAVLVGDDLLMLFDSGGTITQTTHLPLDGSEGYTIGEGGEHVPAGYAIVYEDNPTPDIGLCPADIDGDRRTDITDFGLFIDAFGATGLAPFTGGDMDGDGDVDVLDFPALATDFGCFDPAPMARKAFVVSLSPAR